MERPSMTLLLSLLMADSPFSPSTDRLIHWLAPFNGISFFHELLGLSSHVSRRKAGLHGVGRRSSTDY